MRKDEIYNLLQKSKDKINLSNETISLNDSIEFLIKINIYNKTELDFREDIDLSIFIIKNFKNLKLEFDNNENLKSYYINKLIEKNILAFPKNIIDLNFDLDIKLLKLIKFYKRITYKLKNALYFLFFVIKNKNDLKKVLNEYYELNLSTLPKCSLVKGIKEFIIKYYTSKKILILTGADEDEVIYWFIWPEFGMKVGLKTGDLLVFNPFFAHCCSNPSRRGALIFSQYAAVKPYCARASCQLRSSNEDGSIPSKLE